MSVLDSFPLKISLIILNVSATDISEFSTVGLDFPHTLVITCADARCSPERYLGLQPTDGVVVIRNAGGKVPHEITTILALDNLLRLDDILLVHHTGMYSLYSISFPEYHFKPPFQHLFQNSPFLPYQNHILNNSQSDCGTLLYTDDGVKENLKKRLPSEFTAEIDAMKFGGITNLEQSVTDNLAALRASPFIRKELGDRARGFVFDIKTGLLTEVAAK